MGSRVGSGWAVLTQAEKSERSDAGEIGPARRAAPDLLLRVECGQVGRPLAPGSRFLAVSVLNLAAI